MTRDRDITRARDIERVLEHWLGDGVNEMPDRVYQSIFDRVERQPQALAPRLLRRLPPMNGSLRWIAAAAAIVLLAVVGFAVLRPSSDSGVGASPSPAATPSGSAGAVGDPIPTELKARWMGSERPVPGILPAAGTIINFTADDQFFITQSNENGNHFLNAATSSVGDGQIRLEATIGDDGCANGDVGLYTWSLSPSGRILTIVANSDDCSTRQSAVPGVWFREQCDVVDDNCLGSVDAGTYRSQYFAPFEPGASEPDYGALSYTVPEGWANTADWPDSFDIRRQDASTDGGDAIFLRWTAVLASQADGCPEVPLAGVASTPQAMAEWLADHPGLDSTSPRPVTIGGFDGFSVDLAVAPSWTKTCPFSGGEPTVPLFTDSDPASGFHWAIGLGGRARIYLVDLGDGRLFWADVEAEDDATFQAMLPEASAIVESIEFEPPTP